MTSPLYSNPVWQCGSMLVGIKVVSFNKEPQALNGRYIALILVFLLETEYASSRYIIDCDKLVVFDKGAIAEYVHRASVPPWAMQTDLTYLTFMIYTYFTDNPRNIYHEISLSALSWPENPLFQVPVTLVAVHASNGWQSCSPRLASIRQAPAACARDYSTVSHKSKSDNILMPQGSTQSSSYFRPDRALDERLYDLTDEERSFFKQQTGIQDDDELKAHIVQVQAEAYKVNLCKFTMEIHAILMRQVHPYPCIRFFSFAKWVLKRKRNADAVDICQGSRFAICPDIRICSRQAKRARMRYS
jgi:hypothetical protein